MKQFYKNPGKTICTSIDKISFRRGQKVYSYGDETTYGHIQRWDDYERKWIVQLTSGTNALVEWMEDEPYLEPIFED
jgi:hypothetical protein